MQWARGRRRSRLLRKGSDLCRDGNQQRRTRVVQKLLIRTEPAHRMFQYDRTSGTKNEYDPYAFGMSFSIANACAEAREREATADI